MKNNGLRLKKQKGVGILELILYIGISLPVAIFGVNKYIDYKQTERAEIAGEQLSMFNEAVRQYINFNYSTILTECATGCLVTPELSSDESESDANRKLIAQRVKAIDAAAGADYDYSAGDTKVRPNATHVRYWFVLRDTANNIKSVQPLSYKRTTLNADDTAGTRYFESAEPFLQSNFSLVNSYGGTYKAEIRSGGGKVSAVTTLVLDEKQSKYLGDIIKHAGAYAGQINKDAKLTTSGGGFSFDLSGFSQVTAITSSPVTLFKGVADKENKALSNSAAIAYADARAKAEASYTNDPNASASQSRAVAAQSTMNWNQADLIGDKKINYFVDNGTVDANNPDKTPFIFCSVGYTWSTTENRCKLNCSSIFAN